MANLQDIPLDQLHAHPANSNVMSAELFRKLVHHIKDSSRYPPVIVRPMPLEAATNAKTQDSPIEYQILDGHHRVKALRQLGQATARCVIWEINDDEALLLLATLNRLQGDDDPRQRAALVTQLNQRIDVDRLGKLLPESAERLKSLMNLLKPLPTLRSPQSLESMPVAVHFFLTSDQRSRLEKRLRQLSGSREEALMQIVESKQR